MSGITDYRIVDILELEPVSNRLRNAIYRAYQLGDMPCDTLMEYIQDKEGVSQRLLRLPNIGKKTVNELINLLDKYSEKIKEEEPVVSPGFSIPEELKSVKILSFISAVNCSARLENALTNAINLHELSFDKLGDLDGKSAHELRCELYKVKNIGKKSSEEFLGVLREIWGASNDWINFQERNSDDVNPHENKSDWTSEYLALLDKYGYRDITVEEIIEKIPSRSKDEEKLLKKIRHHYLKSHFYEVLEESRKGPTDISNMLVEDKRQAMQLESLIMAFFWFLSSKNDTDFCHEEYFSKDFSTLSEKEKTVLILRFGRDKLTLSEIGEKIGVTRERVRQIEAMAIKKYLKHNQVGLIRLADSLKTYLKEAGGVCNINKIQQVYATSREKLGIALSCIIKDNHRCFFSRRGDYIISRDLKEVQEKTFQEIESALYRQAGRSEKITIQNIAGVSNEVLRYFLFVNQHKFSMKSDGEVEIVIKSAAERARIVLAIAGQPLHTSEAARLYKIIFKEDINEHAIGSTLGRLPDALIVGRGTYALYSHLKLTHEDIEFIKDSAYELIKKEGHYISSRVILSHINQINPGLRKKEENFNYYLVLGVLQDDERYVTKRGFMVGLDIFGDHIPLETEIEDIVENYGPVYISDIIELLRPTRGELTNGSVRNTLIASDDIFLSHEKRMWDVADRIFNDILDIRELQVAIRIASYKEMIALSAMYNRVRSTGMNYGVGTILSIIWKDPEIIQRGDYVGFYGKDAEIDRYYATGEPGKFSDLDYRNYSKEKQVETGILEMLIKEFDHSV